jgi:hypothetical protein
MKLEDVKLTPVYPNLSMGATVPLMELTTYNIAFKISNGKVVELYPEANETEWVLNIKRGIISAFQVTLSDTDGTRIVKETDVLGTCETKLTQFTISEDEIIIKKNRDRDTCSKLGVFTILPTNENQEAKFVDGTVSAEYTVNKDGVIQKATTEQNEKLTPLSADAGTVLTTIRQTLILTDTQIPTTEIKFPEEFCPVEMSTLKMTVEACDLHEQPTKEGCIADIRNLIEIMTDIDPHDIPHFFIDLIELMKTCNKTELDSLRREYVQPKAGSNDKKKMDKHSFFLDALTYVGTEPALDLIVDLVTTDDWFTGDWLTDELTTLLDIDISRKSELTLSLSFLPVHTTCPCLVLDHILRIVEQRNTMIAKLVLGAVINKVLNMPQPCSVLIDKAANFLTRNLNESLKNLPGHFNVQRDEPYRKYYDDAVHTIKALGNAGLPSTLNALKSSFENKALQIEGRAVAVYALQSMAQRVPTKVQDIALEIYSDTREEIEIRIAAFLTFMKTMTIYSPTPTAKLMQLMNSVWTEPNSYVKSFVCSYWTAIERSENPTLLYLRHTVYYQMRTSGIFLVCPAADKGYFSSKADRHYLSLADFNLPLGALVADMKMPRSLPRDVMGVELSTGVVMNEYSWLPHSASSKVTANLFGYDFELFEVGGRSTDLQQLITHVFGPTGYLRRGTRDLKESGLPLSEMEINETEDIDISGYLKFLGQEIGWKQWVKDDLMGKLYHHENLTLLRQSITDAISGKLHLEEIAHIVYHLGDYLHFAWNGGGTIWRGKQDMTKTARFVDVKRIIPTIIGMPLDLTSKAAAHLQLGLEGQVNFSTLSVTDRVREYFWPSHDSTPDAIHSSIHISPKFSAMASVNLILNAYHFKPKLVFLAKATSQFEQQISADLYDWSDSSSSKLKDTLVKVKLQPELPGNKAQLLSATYNQFAEVNGSLFELSINKRETVTCTSRTVVSVIGGRNCLFL